MPTLTELFNQASKDPNIVSTPEWQQQMAEWNNQVKQAGTAPTTPTIPGAQEGTMPSDEEIHKFLMAKPEISSSKLANWLADPTFYKWAMANYPDEPYPPTKERRREYYEGYKAAGGEPADRISIDGLGAGTVRPGQRFDRGQAGIFNQGMNDEFGGNPPILMNAKSKGFIFRPFKHTVPQILGKVAGLPGDLLKSVSKHMNLPGAVSGAVGGAMVGGPYGALVGGGLGAMMPKGDGGGAGGGGKGNVQRHSLLTPQQENLSNFAAKRAMADIGTGPDIKAATNQFRGQYMPQLFEGMERMGGGQQESSALAPHMMAAEGQFRTGLEQLKSQQGMQLGNLAMGRSAFENVMSPRQQQWWEQPLQAATGKVMEYGMNKLLPKV